MELAPGTILAGRFAIDGSPLGAGASGVVWPAVDRATGRRVVAKVLHPDRAHDPEALARLQDEAAIAGRLSHPNVVEVVGLWSDGPGRWVLVSERIDGVALSEVGRLAPQAVTALGLELTAALEAADAAGLTHGDVRPGNVLLSNTGARLFDFGVSRLGTERTDLRPGETAPERLDGGPVSRAADVYGLGVVLFFALHGRLPFEGPTPWAVIGSQRQRLPAGEGPRGLASLCRELLHPDPVERPDLGMVRRALDHLARKPEARLRMPRPVPPFRPGSPWVVHGVDPGTGAPAIVRSGLSKSQAKALLRRLRADGWQVRGVRDAFGWRDVGFVMVLALLVGTVLPLIGVLPAVWFGMLWRAETVRPSVVGALPPVSVPVPQKAIASGSESGVAAGLLLLLLAASLAWWPIAALVPAVLLLILAMGTWRATRNDPGQVAREGRVSAALAELRTVLDTRPLLIEDALGLTGEVDRLESDWIGGQIDADRVLVRVDDLLERATHVPGAPPVEGPRVVLEALRRPRS